MTATFNRPTVAAGMVKALLDFCRTLGVSSTELMPYAAINEAALADPDNRIDFATYMHLMRHAKRMTQQPALALLFGEAIDLHEFSVVGLIARSAQTLDEAYQQINRYSALVVEIEGLGDGDRFALVPEGDDLWLVDQRPDPNACPELTETTFARMHCTYARDFGGEPLLREIHVTHDDPGYRAEYERIFNMPVVFNSDKNAVPVDGSRLPEKITHANTYIFGLLSTHTAALLAELKASKTHAGQVESILIPLLHTGAANMDLVADRMGMSRQQLYRKLKAENRQFEQILDGLRHQMALNYLKNQRLSVKQIAYLLGFSHPNAFNRAFKRWTGHTPKG
ncbi:AraC family transcriptional regulator ligand-binding domain-containing protein [Marinicella meishanensis]|uniref:AraC family transcriptional regulator ligand-binding domain-containing protein n=1 Tax=Marinicella meishanensis TaxID=2873263 RepID=UPI001CC0D143|nr:AraC family transcriptional regulator ligand-binding domain-containing protein [Marinicella sp. NBU2979]